ncbi:MAG: LacI family transcriptional regulator [Spirochaetes bacterium]|nr:LacI family transcriptional regulator [Spirochaetota bacterium]
MKITIKDIAQKSDVSISTVSKIISGKYKTDNIKISEATIERVQKVAKEMNYEPDYGAQLLSTGKTFTIGIYMPKSKNGAFYFSHYYAGLIDSIEKEAVKSGYDILLINYGSYINKFNTKRIDGLIIIEQYIEDKDLEYLLKENKPFVIINNLIDMKLNLYSVNIDNYAGIKMAVEYFIENNHKKLAFIGELVEKPQKEHMMRLEYFKEILKENKMDVNEEMLLIDGVQGITENIKKHYYNQLSGYMGMEYLYKKYWKKFTGVFCANDVIALGAMNYLYKKGIKVPEDVSIIGFDNVDFAEHLMGGLTTIRQPLDKMGKNAFELLLRLMNKEGTEEKRKIEVDPELIARGTVAKI